MKKELVKGESKKDLVRLCLPVADSLLWLNGRVKKQTETETHHRPPPNLHTAATLTIAN